LITSYTGLKVKKIQDAKKEKQRAKYELEKEEVIRNEI
jgi:hypothetical protein